MVCCSSEYFLSFIGDVIDRKTGELRFDFLDDIPTHSLRLKNDKV
jgi:hypothetical protein